MARELNYKEAQTLPLLLTGKSIRAISDELGVPLKTVEHRLRIMYAKLGVSSRCELIAGQLRARVELLTRCEKVLTAIDEYLEELICYASTTAEYRPNKLRVDIRALLAELEALP
jgi:DNA-binding CsgD family transcriptional regulator